LAPLKRFANRTKNRVQRDTTLHGHYNKCSRCPRTTSWTCSRASQRLSWFMTRVNSHGSMTGRLQFGKVSRCRQVVPASGSLSEVTDELLILAVQSVSGGACISSPGGRDSLALAL